MIPNTKLMLRKTEKCKQAEVFKQSRVFVTTPLQRRSSRV